MNERKKERKKIKERGERREKKSKEMNRHTERRDIVTFSFQSLTR